MEVLIKVFGLILILCVVCGTGVLCYDLYVINYYILCRIFSCKKRANKAIIPEAIVTVHPITVVARVVPIPEAVIILNIRTHERNSMHTT